MMIYQLYEDPEGHWHWQLVGPDYSLLARSAEPYSDERECRDAINLVQGSWHARTEHSAQPNRSVRAERSTPKVKQFMSARVGWLAPNASLQEAAQKMRDQRVRGSAR
jgi:uncharacterized protein YegP (UPF0339 family)